MTLPRPPILTRMYVFLALGVLALVLAVNSSCGAPPEEADDGGFSQVALSPPPPPGYYEGSSAPAFLGMYVCGENKFFMYTHFTQVKYTYNWSDQISDRGIVSPLPYRPDRNLILDCGESHGMSDNGTVLYNSGQIYCRQTLKKTTGDVPTVNMYIPPYGLQVTKKNFPNAVYPHGQIKIDLRGPTTPPPPMTGYCGPQFFVAPF